MKQAPKPMFRGLQNFRDSKSALHAAGGVAARQGQHFLFGG